MTAMGACATKQSLLADLEAAHSRVRRLDREEVEAVMRDDWEARCAYRIELRIARRRRDEARRAIRVHIDAHHC
jgi:hypothetical protein